MSNGALKAASRRFRNLEMLMAATLETFSQELERAKIPMKGHAMMTATAKAALNLERRRHSAHKTVVDRGCVLLCQL